MYYLRNVTAGIFAGDRYNVSAVAEPGTTIRIGATSATRVHAMPGGHASSTVRLEAMAGSSLVWGPHTTILQAASCLSQSLSIRLGAGARAYVAEVLVLGRIASGESCDFSRFESGFEVSDSTGRILYEERYVLAPGEILDAALGNAGAAASPPGLKAGVVVSLYALGISDDEARSALQRVVSTSPAYAGVSTLPNNAGLVVRGLAVSLSQGCSLAERCLDALGV